MNGIGLISKPGKKAKTENSSDLDELKQSEFRIAHQVSI